MHLMPISLNRLRKCKVQQTDPMDEIYRQTISLEALRWQLPAGYSAAYVSLGESAQRSTIFGFVGIVA